jgi:RNA polymerase sigma factor (sigma-70 family)
VGSKRTLKDGSAHVAEDAFAWQTSSDQPEPVSAATVATDGDCRSGADIYGSSRHRIPLTDEQRDLAVQYLPLAESIAARWCINPQIGRDELLATAYLALVEAAQTFDPCRNVHFATFARRRIRGALRDCQRLLMSDNWRGRMAPRPMYQRLPPNAECRGRLVGIEPDSPVGTQIEAAEAVERWLRGLPKAHAAACRLIYIEGKTQEEVAALVGCSKSYLSRLHQQALTWLIEDMRAARRDETAELSRKPD